jgi:hypothetical protein
MTASSMNAKSSLPGRRHLTALGLKDGQCPGDHWHFKGAAREVYKYLRLLATRHGGFVFPSVGNIAANTKNWRNQPMTYSYRQCSRIIRMFISIGILSVRKKVKIRGRTYEGWDFLGHRWWAEIQGDICEFKRWVEYEDKYSQRFKEQDVLGNVLEDVLPDVLDTGRDVLGDVLDHSDISALKSLETSQLKMLAGS